VSLKESFYFTILATCWGDLGKHTNPRFDLGTHYNSYHHCTSVLHNLYCQPSVGKNNSYLYWC